MKYFSEISLLFPEWLTPWIVVAAVAAAIMGFNRVAVSLGIYVAIDLFIAPMLEPWLDQLPLWTLALAALLLPLLVLNAIISLVFGKEAGGHFTGTWLVRIFDLLILGPFHIVGYLLRLLIVR